MPKISALPNLTTPDGADELPINDVSATTTKKFTLTILKEWLQAITSFVTRTMITNAAVDKTKIDFTTAGGVWWEELARVTASTAVSSQTTPTFTAKKYLMIINVWIPSGGGNAANIRFNGDSGNNYNFRYNSNGGTENSSVSQNTMSSGSADSGTIGLDIREIINIANKEKLVVYHEVVSKATGAATSPDRYELAGKWVNTSAAITSITQFASGNNLGAGSELIVLGHD